MPSTHKHVAHHRTAILRGTVLAAVFALSGSGSLAAAADPQAARSTAASAASAPAAPSCDQIRGAELGVTDAWRIVRTGSPFAVSADAAVVACRRNVAGPAQVRVLGTSKVIDDSGEGSESPSGGPYLTLMAFQGSRVVLRSRTFTGPSYFDRTGSISFLDLDRGTRTALLPDERSAAVEGSEKPSRHTLETVLTPAGALAYAPLDEAPPAKPTLGAWTLWDAAGQRPAPALRDVALSRGSSASATTARASAGLYFRDAAGTPGRLPLQGAATTEAIPADPALAWQTLPLERTPKARGDFNAELLVAPSTVAPEATFNTVPQLEFSTASKDRKAVVRILDADGERRLGTLAPGSFPELRVLASSAGVAFLAGRFATHPSQRRVLLATTSRKAAKFFDRPARRAIERPGMVITAGGRQAMADGDHLRLWVYPSGRVHRVRGVHDLAFTTGASAGLYSTDRDGRVAFRRR